MNKITKNVVSFAVICATVALPLAALAVNNPIQNVSGGGVFDIQTLVNTVLSKLWIVFAAAAVIAFLYAGLIFLTANGAPDKIATARLAFLWGVVGIAVGILAYTIITIVSSLLR